MVEIPAFFVGPSQTVRNGWFDGTAPVLSGPGSTLQEISKALSRDVSGRSPVLICDCPSLYRRALIPEVLKTMKVRGHDIWFLTWIEDADDLFDAFNTTAEVVLGPYHASSSDADLRDILSVSDSFIPAVFVSGGCAVLRNGSAGDLHKAVADLERMGFGRVCLVDADGTMPADILDPETTILFSERPLKDYCGDQILPLRISSDI